MRMNFLHGLGALFTAFIILVRVHNARKHAAKREKLLSPSYSCGDACDIVPQDAADDSPCSFMYLRHSFLTDATFCARPKCKRDPDISIDGEVISVHPKELDYDKT